MVLPMLERFAACSVHRPECGVHDMLWCSWPTCSKALQCSCADKDMLGAAGVCLCAKVAMVI